MTDRINKETGEIVVVPQSTSMVTHYVPPDEALQLQQVSSALFQSGLYNGLKNEAGAFAAVLWGRERGVGAMTSLQNMFIVNGKLACSAQMIQALAYNHAGVTTTVKRSDNQECQLIMHRPNHPDMPISFTMDDAKKAGLLRSGSSWAKYPSDMLYARAITKGVRRIAPDAITGFYTVDEIKPDWTEAEEIQVEFEPATQPQLDLIVRLLSQKDIDEDLYNDIQIKASSGKMSKAEAGKAIGVLKKEPNKKGE